jgi:type I restriction enzyme S subunit
MTKTATQKTRPGYQMTKLGWIPEDWEVSQLGASTTLLTNGFVGKAKNHYVEDGGVLYLQGYNIHELGFNLSGVKYVSKSFHLKQKKSTLRLNDLLTIQTGDVGLTSMVDEALVGSNCHALIISRLKEDKYYPHFYKLYFNSYIGRGSLKRIETGTTMKHLNIKDMKKWHIPLPPLAEKK